MNALRRKVILLELVSFSCCNILAQKNHYNILFIMSDDHTSQMISCYDKRYVNTPNIDRIAEHGVQFVNSFVANSVSGPSRACILTGKHSCSNKFYTNSKEIFDGSQQTFPKLLQKAGYQTALIGKWHLKSTPTGFDYWEILPGQGDYYNPDFITSGNVETRNTGYVTNIITDKAIDWLENKREDNKPFCLMIHHKAPHRNWMPDICDLNLYEDKEFELPYNYYDNYEGRVAASLQKMNISKDMNVTYDLKVSSDSLYDKRYELAYNRMNTEQRNSWDKFYRTVTDDYKANWNNPEWKFNRYMRDYMKTIESLDRNIGRVIDYLEKNNLIDNTLIVYTSDQGFFMGEHGWFDKRFMYEESMRTPLVMMLPEEMGKRGVINEMVQNIDIAPTFLELAGIEIPEDIHGLSLLPLLNNEDIVDWRSSLYYHYYEFPGPHSVRKHYGIRTKDYKLMHFYGDIDSWELYDMRKDKHEMNNLYDDKEYKGVVADLKKELSDLQKLYNDSTGTVN